MEAPLLCIESQQLLQQQRLLTAAVRAQKQLLIAAARAQQQVPAAAARAQQQRPAAATRVQQELPAAATRVHQQLPAAAARDQQRLPAAATPPAQQQLPAAATHVHHHHHILHEAIVQQQLPAAATRVHQQLPAAAARDQQQLPAAAAPPVQQQPQIAEDRASPDIAPDEQPDQNPSPAPVLKTVNQILLQRRNKRKEALYQKYLELSLRSSLDSSCLVTQKNKAYDFMNEHGVALIKKGITLNERIQATIQLLCTGDNDESCWDSIFEKEDAKGGLSYGTKKRQQLVFDEDWIKAGHRSSSPRMLWRNEIVKKTNNFLRDILQKKILRKYKTPYHTLLRSSLHCPNQCWHYDQFYPGSDAWKMCQGKEFPFVIVVAVEEKALSFLDVEVGGKPTRICMEKGDVLLVRGDCLHRGTDYTYGGPESKRYHVRAHAYIDPKSFKRPTNTTFHDNKYPSFLQDYYK